MEDRFYARLLFKKEILERDNSARSGCRFCSACALLRCTKRVSKLPKHQETMEKILNHEKNNSGPMETDGGKEESKQEPEGRAVQKEDAEGKSPVATDGAPPNKKAKLDPNEIDAEPLDLFPPEENEPEADDAFFADIADDDYLQKEDAGLIEASVADLREGPGEGAHDTDA